MVPHYAHWTKEMPKGVWCKQFENHPKIHSEEQILRGWWVDMIWSQKGAAFLVANLYYSATWGPETLLFK